jgi:hypothetical protein
MITNPAWVDRQLEILRLKKEKEKQVVKAQRKVVWKHP